MNKPSFLPYWAHDCVGELNCVIAVALPALVYGLLWSATPNTTGPLLLTILGGILWLAIETAAVVLAIVWYLAVGPGRLREV